MNGHFETNGIYPLSTEPAEGYSGDPLERSGKVVITHTNRKFVKLNESEQGYEFVESRTDATKFADYSEASLVAAKLLEKARTAAQVKKAA